MQSNLDKYNTTKTFNDEITGSWVYGRKWDKAILLLIEYFSNDNSNPTFIPINSKLHLEHILPQNPNEDWDGIFTDDEVEIWTNSLANLTLLSMKKNIQAQNYAFEEKKEIYSNKNNVETSFRITQKILENNKWEVEELEKREENLVSKIKEKIDLF
jgi:hypothetical protein